jgi:hypothetical protein
MLRPIDLHRPFDVRTFPSMVPSDATIKGLYPQQIADWMKSKGRPYNKSYIQFKDYPQREYATLICLAVAGDPRPPRMVMSEITADSFALLRATMLGRVVFGVLGNDVLKVLAITAKGYSMSGTNMRAEVLSLSEGHYRVRLNDVPGPIEGLQSGIIGGAIVACGRTVTSGAVELEDEVNGVLELTWR